MTLFQPGDRVEHSSYGTGTVRSTDHDGRGMRVEFDSNRDDHVVDARDCTLVDADGVDA